MTVQINWPGAARSLQRAFGLKGAIRLVADEVVAPVSVVSDLERGPWAESNAVGGRGDSAKVVGENSAVAFLPGQGITFKLDQIEINNLESSVGRFFMGPIAPSNLGGLTLVGAAQPVRNLQSAMAQFPAGVGIPVTGSVIQGFRNVGQTGALVYQLQVPANASRTLRFPTGVFIDGSLLDGLFGNVAGGFIVWGPVASHCAVSYLGREYPNRQ